MLGSGADHLLSRRTGWLPWLLAAATALAHPDLAVQIEALDHAIGAQPGHASLYLRRGDLHRRHGDFAAAEVDFATARQLDPALAALDWREARALVDAGRPAEGEALLDRYLLLNPADPAALEERARARSLQGLHLAAAGDLAAAIAHAAHPAPVLFSRHALELARAGGLHFQAARAVVEDGQKRFPGEVALLAFGVDLDLAMDEAASARKQILQLPLALRELPAWTRRDVLASCLEARPDAKCLAQARAQLAMVLEASPAAHADR